MFSIIKKLVLFILLSVIIGCSSSGGEREAEDTDVPIIRTQPVSQTLPADKTAVFSVEALSGGVSYQWQHSIEGSIWNDITDATQSTYEILAQTSEYYNWIWFRCVLTNSIGSTCSSSACLTVVTVVYVDSSQSTNLPDGQSWDYAYTTLQDALSTAPADSEIWVAAGTYTPGDTRGDSFTLKETVDVYGGFNGDETFREARDPEDNVTILSGDIGATGDNSDNCYHVVTGANNAILDGFTISDGNASAATGILARGGGIFNNYSSPTISNCTFSNNSAYNYGGGMYNNYSGPTVINCTFLNDAAAFGGGIFNYSSSTTVTNCTFSGNHTAFYGGGIYNDVSSSPTVTGCAFLNNSTQYGGGMFNNNSSSPTVINCMFSGNFASLYGGGMYNESSSSPAVTNCTFSGNSSAEYGGGIFNYSSSPTVTNCTFSDNSAPFGGLAMFNESSSSPTVTNCILWGNMASGDHQIYDFNNSSTTITYSCVQGGSQDNGNIADHPALNDDLTLQSDSPCIDTGNNNAVPYGTFQDLAGNDRFTGYSVDMGAYEYQQ